VASADGLDCSRGRRPRPTRGASLSGGRSAPGSPSTARPCGAASLAHIDLVAAVSGCGAIFGSRRSSSAPRTAQLRGLPRTDALSVRLTGSRRASRSRRAPTCRRNARQLTNNELIGPSGCSFLCDQCCVRVASRCICCTQVNITYKPLLVFWELSAIFALRHRLVHGATRGHHTDFHILRFPIRCSIGGRCPNDESRAHHASSWLV
jgi:hypothetical protein